MISFQIPIYPTHSIMLPVQFMRIYFYSIVHANIILALVFKKKKAKACF